MIKTRWRCGLYPYALNYSTPMGTYPCLHNRAIVRTGIDQKRGIMRTINQVLDKAQRVQKVKSDYKLGLCLGIGANSLSNYRTGKTLPDDKACLKLAPAMGEDPAVLVAEMQAQRSKDEETRALWLSIAARLQAGIANCKFLAVLAIVSIAGAALPAWAAIGFVSFSVEQSVYYVKRWIKNLVLPLFARCHQV